MSDFCPPLVWSSKGKLYRIFFGGKSYFDVCKQLKSRTLFDFEKSWGYSEIYAMILNVSVVIKDEFCWPNHYFLPQDPCAILFWEHSSHCSQLSAVIDIENILLGTISIKENFWENLHDFQYSQLFFEE